MIYDVLLRTRNASKVNCYILLAIWFLFVVGSVYRFLEPKRKLPSEAEAKVLLKNYLEVDAKTERIFRICNLPNKFVAGHEGSWMSFFLSVFFFAAKFCFVVPHG